MKNAKNNNNNKVGLVFAECFGVFPGMFFFLGIFLEFFLFFAFDLTQCATCSQVCQCNCQNALLPI
jgi:hypothetical protein